MKTPHKVLTKSQVLDIADLFGSRISLGLRDLHKRSIPND